MFEVSTSSACLLMLARDALENKGMTITLNNIDSFNIFKKGISQNH
jgi:hypothetical protein